MDTRKKKREQRAREMLANRSLRNAQQLKEALRPVVLEMAALEPAPLESVEPVDLSYPVEFNLQSFDADTPLPFQITHYNEDIWINLENSNEDINFFEFSTDENQNDLSGFNPAEQAIHSNTVIPEFKEEPIFFNDEYENDFFPVPTLNDLGYQPVKTQEDILPNTKKSNKRKREDDDVNYEESAAKKFKSNKTKTKPKLSKDSSAKNQTFTNTSHSLFMPADDNNNFTIKSLDMEFQTYNVDKAGNFVKASND